MRLDLYDSLVCPYDASTASVHVEPPPPHGATRPITRIPPSDPYGDLHANLEQGDSSLIYEQLPADGHVHPDGSVHPGVPPQPEQHHGPPPPSTYGNLPWQRPGYTTAPSPAHHTRMMRLQALQRNLLPVQSEQEVAIPLLQPWPPPVFLIPCSAVKPGVYSPLSAGFKGGREINDIYTLPLFQIRHFILTDLVSHSPQGEERE